VINAATHPFNLDAPGNFETNEPTVTRKDVRLTDTNLTNDDLARLTGLTGREIEVKFKSSIDSTTEAVLPENI
jgi:hypothetical protein